MATHESSGVMWICIYMCLLCARFQSVLGYGYMNITIESFTNNDGTTMALNPCDSESHCDTILEFCMDRVGESSSNELCGMAYHRTTPLEDTNSFQNLHLEPTVMHYGDIGTANITVRLIVDIFDDDIKVGGDDRIDRLETTIQLPLPNRDGIRVSIGSFTRMDLAIFTYCEEDYYGSLCTRYCMPNDDEYGHFSCDSEGDFFCNEGYTGKACTIPTWTTSEPHDVDSSTVSVSEVAELAGSSASMETAHLDVSEVVTDTMTTQYDAITQSSLTSTEESDDGSGDIMLFNTDSMELTTQTWDGDESVDSLEEDEENSLEEDEENSLEEDEENSLEEDEENSSEEDEENSLGEGDFQMSEVTGQLTFRKDLNDTHYSYLKRYIKRCANDYFDTLSVQVDYTVTSCHGTIQLQPLLTIFMFHIYIHGKTQPTDDVIDLLVEDAYMDLMPDNDTCRYFQPRAVTSHAGAGTPIVLVLVCTVLAALVAVVVALAVRKRQTLKREKTTPLDSRPASVCFNRASLYSDSGVRYPTVSPGFRPLSVSSYKSKSPTSSPVHQGPDATSPSNQSTIVFFGKEFDDDNL